MLDCEHQQQLEERQRFEMECLPHDQSLLLELQSKMQYHLKMAELLRQDIQMVREGRDLEWEKWYE